MKVLVKEKNINHKEVRCDCNRYLFTLKERTLFINCRRCKREHKIQILAALEQP